MKRTKPASAVRRPNTPKASTQTANVTKGVVEKTVTKATKRAGKEATKEAARQSARQSTRQSTRQVATRGPSDWLRRMADLEDACDTIAAGRRDDETATTADGLDDASRLRSALGRLFELSRRVRGLTPAEFASAHRITMQELVALERGERVHPNPRTIRALAKTAGVAASPCLQLAGCTARVDPAIEREAMRFVSATGTAAKLTRAEQRRFQAFVKVLSRPA